MAEKPVAPAKKRAKRKVAARKTPAPESASIVGHDGMKLTIKTKMADDPAVRRQAIAIEAYHLAERRGFAAGHEVEDWMAAEAAVDAR